MFSHKLFYVLGNELKIAAVVSKGIKKKSKKGKKSLESLESRGERSLEKKKKWGIMDIGIPSGVYTCTYVPMYPCNGRSV